MNCVAEKIKLLFTSATRSTAPKHVCHRFVIGFQPEMDIAPLKKEMAEFKDIVYYNVYDTYRRNFIKWFTMYAWQQRYASDVPILFKLDSDTAIDLKRAFHWILRRFDTGLNLDDGWIVCEKMENQQPVRSPKTSAWYVPVREYAYDLYPPYCYGYAVIMSTLAVNLSIDAMKEVNMFHMDDVLYTGVVAPLRDIQLYDFKGIRTQ
uniref:Hexosyltransferase n=1 Tax=Bursaphelenchus xylophilus TaxID=6326 RepID=A0A1I7SJ06_BURXY